MTSLKTMPASARNPSRGRRNRYRRTTRWRKIAEVAGPTLVLLLALGAWVIWRSVEARQELVAASEALGAAQRAASVDSTASLTPYISAASRHAEAAHHATNDIAWKAAARIPVLGRSLRTVSGVAAAADDFSRRVLPEVEAAYRDLRTLRGSFRDGIPLPPLERAAPRLARAADVTAADRSAVAALPATWLFPSVARARSAFLARLTAVHARLQPPADTLAILPKALGAAGPRTYFVAFLNPAEARAGGGFFSAYAELRTDGGKIKLGPVGSTTDLRDLDTPPPGIDAEYQKRYGEYGGDVAWSVTNLSPHFPYDARAWAAMYRASTGRPVDGVLALDPHAMAVLLSATGPVRLPTGQPISAGNVVSFIERDEYALPVADKVRKDMLKEVARATFGKLLAGQANAGQLARQLSTAAMGGHARFTSTHPDEQARVEAYSVAGVVLDTKQPFAMLAINNASSGKLDTYLESKLSYVVKECTASKRSVQVTTTLTNRAPTRGLPAYAAMYQGSLNDHPLPGESESAVSVFLTQGSHITAARLDGGPLPLSPGPKGSSSPFVEVSTERGHRVASIFVDLAPGHSTSFTLTVVEAPSRSPVILMTQPLAQPTTSTSDTRLCVAP